MKHSIYNSELETTLEVDETLCENVALHIEDNDGVVKSHYLRPDELENLIHVLKYVHQKKKEINPVYGKRVSALSISSIRAAKENAQKIISK